MTGFFNNYTFPNVYFNVRDDSRRTIVVDDNTGLHNPLFVVFAERGPLNVPTLGSADYLMSIYGDSLFDPTSKFFNHPNLFAMYAARRQNILLVRVADPTATIASMVLELSVSEQQIIQYQKDAFGNRVLDSNGDPIPVFQSDGVTPVTELGVVGTFSTRPMTSNETLRTIQPVTSIVGGVTTTKYPILASRLNSPGAAGNNFGYRLYWNPEFEQSVVDNTLSMIYQFEPIRKSEDVYNTPVAIRDIFSVASNQVSLKKDALDQSVSRNYYLEAVVAQNYFIGQAAQQVTTIPFETYVYSDYVEAIGQLVLDASPELITEAASPFLINILSAKDQSNRPYDHFTLTNSGSYVDQNRIMYLQGGSDGDISLANLNVLTENYVSGDTYPEIGDMHRYKISHFYDSGYPLATKRNLVKFLALRDDVKIDFTTQDVTLQPNTKADDQSTGSSLRGRLLLYPESVRYSTQTVRASIYQQCGVLNEYPDLKFPVPCSLDRLVKRCAYEATGIRQGVPKTRPRSEVTMFKKINWTPVGNDHKQLNWDTGLNYIQYADTRTLFWPDFRSVYPYDNSVLSDDTFADAICYTKTIVRYEWTNYSGDTTRPSRRAAIIKKAIEDEIYLRFQGDIIPEVTYTPTPAYTATGYRDAFDVRLRTSIPSRVWDITIPVDRIEG